MRGPEVGEVEGDDVVAYDVVGVLCEMVEACQNAVVDRPLVLELVAGCGIEGCQGVYDAGFLRDFQVYGETAAQRVRQLEGRHDAV